MRPDDLLQIATDLARMNPGRPRRTNLCRATGAAYYALFHCLAWSCANTLVGGAGANRSRAAWIQVYRALEHRHAKKRCDAQIMQKFPAAIQDFAEAFVWLQRRRHLADYDPEFPFSKSEVIGDIQRAQKAIARFSRAPVKDRRAFAVHVLMKVRPDT